MVLEQLLRWLSQLKSEVDVVVFFADFFLLDGAGIVSQAEYRWECVVGLKNNFDCVRMRRVGQQHVGRL